MKNSLYFSILCLCLFACSSSNDDSTISDDDSSDPTTMEEANWEPIANLPSAGRQTTFSFSHNGFGYAGFGRTETDSLFNDLWKYDVGTDSWAEIPSLPSIIGRDKAFYFLSDESKLYIGGGQIQYATGNPNDFYVLDLVSNTWIEKINTVPTNLVSASGVFLNGKGYVIGGYEQGLFPRNDIWRYDPILDTWEKMNDFPGGTRKNATSFVVNNIMFYGLGGGTAENAGSFTDLWEYNESDDSWEEILDFNAYSGTVGRNTFTATSGKYAYIGVEGSADLGLDANVGLKAIWSFDSETYEIAKVVDYPDPKTQTSGFLIGNYMYVGLGYKKEGETNEFFRYKFQ